MRRSFSIGEKVVLWSVEGGLPQGKAPRYGSDEPDERSYHIQERIVAVVYCVDPDGAIHARASERHGFNSWFRRPNEESYYEVRGKRDAFYCSLDGCQWYEQFYDNQTLLFEEGWAIENAPHPCFGKVGDQLIALPRAA
jgi:hypothetical protein